MSTFSPLYVGSVVVTVRLHFCPDDGYSFFQSPIRRVSSCNISITYPATARSNPFSPLYVGSVVVTEIEIVDMILLVDFQSPIRRVSSCNDAMMTAHRFQQASFQSPIRRVSSCNVRPLGAVVQLIQDFQSPIRRVSSCNRYRNAPAKLGNSLSVPYTSGQ